jgi:hypothetical protein
MAAILIILAIVAVGIGFLELSQATMGVGILAIGCLMGILARIAQASAHHKELTEKLEALRNNIESKAV